VVGGTTVGEVVARGRAGVSSVIVVVVAGRAMAG